MKDQSPQAAREHFAEMAESSDGSVTISVSVDFAHLCKLDWWIEYQAVGSRYDESSPHVKDGKLTRSAALSTLACKALDMDMNAVEKALR